MIGWRQPESELLREEVEKLREYKYDTEKREDLLQYRSDVEELAGAYIEMVAAVRKLIDESGSRVNKEDLCEAIGYEREIG